MKCKTPKFSVQLKNFSLFTSKNLKIYGFRPYLFKKLQFFFISIKIILFTLKFYFLQQKMPKVSKKSVFYLSTFLSVIRQNFEYNLRTLANLS